MDKDLEVEIQTQVDEISKKLMDKCKLLNKKEEDLIQKQENEWMEILENRKISPFKNYDKPVLIVVATQKTEEEYKETEEYKNIETLIYINSFFRDDKIITPLSLEIVSENNKGLSEVYNKYITKEYSGYYVCFIHDDVKITDLEVFQKLQKAHQKSEIVGVAGATKVEVPFTLNRPTLWHILSVIPEGPNGMAKKHQSGYVTHIDREGKQWTSNFGKTPEFCRLIDGLFMSFDVDKCVKYGFSFDERFTFHHYDLSACLIAAKCGLNIITYPINTQHRSEGDFRNEAWKQSHIKFVQVYGNFKI